MNKSEIIEYIVTHYPERKLMKWAGTTKAFAPDPKIFKMSKSRLWKAYIAAGGTGEDGDYKHYALEDLVEPLQRRAMEDWYASALQDLSLTRLKAIAKTKTSRRGRSLRPGAMDFLKSSRRAPVRKPASKGSRSRKSASKTHKSRKSACKTRSR